MQQGVEWRAPRALVFVYAAACYALFLVTLVWAIAFLANARGVHAVDGDRTGSWLTAAAIDGALLLLFAVQHSVMARRAWKQRLARVLPPAAERATYVVATSVVLIVLFVAWRPLPATIWHVQRVPWVQIMWAGYALGWGVAVASTFIVDHLHFFGLRQAYAHARGAREQSPGFTQRWLYQFVRHPLMVGLVLAFWSTPHMTAGHLLFALAGTGYIAVGVRFEERDLARELGDEYIDYVQRVPAFIPRPRSRRPAAAAPETAGRR